MDAGIAPTAPFIPLPGNREVTRRQQIGKPGEPLAEPGSDSRQSLLLSVSRRMSIAPAALYKTAPTTRARGARTSHPPVFGGLRAGPSRLGVAEKPSTYVLCAEDCAASTEAQREHAKRVVSAVELPAGHTRFSRGQNCCPGC